MCGIVGYYGSGNPKEVILSGLRALEYRGYDSAGIAIFDNGHLKRVRAEGKLVNLEKKLEGEKFSGDLGIGHTRWATHGKPSETNAHPHSVGGVSIVHNGIIENYEELRKILLSRGAVVESETDSELIAHLVSEKIGEGKDLLQSVFETLPLLKGAFSVLAVSEKFADEMVAFKNGPPLIVGLGEDQVVVASDLQAIMPHTRKVIFLNDDEVVSVKKSEVKMFTNDQKALTVKPKEIDWNPEMVEKMGFSHFMLKEIFEQPRAVASAIAPHILVEKHEVQLSGLGFGQAYGSDLDPLKDLAQTHQVFAEAERIFIVACGTSFYAGLVGEYFIERLSRVPVEVDIASEFRYRYPVIPKNSVVVLISQSGETADTLAALRMAKKDGAKILSLCNVKNSSIDREADGHIYMNAGVEVGVASTKAFTATLSLLSVLSIQLAKAKGRITTEDEKKYVAELIATPSQMEKALAYDKFFEEASEHLKTFKGFLYMGRGANYAIALEGALKLKELAYLHAEGYAAGEMKHGPLALIDEKMAVIMLLPEDELFEKTLSNLQEARARGGRIISIGTGPNGELEEISDHYLSLPQATWFTNPILSVIPLQLMSYHLADSLGLDVDQPRNLAKSVTVE